MRRRCVFLLLSVGAVGCKSEIEVKEAPPGILDAPQAFNTPDRCAPCHARQYQESLQSVMSGYRGVSPLMNSLELAGNFLVQDALESGAIKSNLRPIYETPSKPDLPSGENALTADSIETADQARSAFCIGCHAPAIVLLGEDPDRREIPEWEGVTMPPDPACDTSSVACFRQITNVRPLRDYHLVDQDGRQVLADQPGGPPPPGSGPSLGAHGVTCDNCHNVQAPDLSRSLAGDGYANNALVYEGSYFKVGPFADALPVGPLPEAGEPVEFHQSSADPDKIDFIRSSDFCNACHDVRVPAPNLLAPEGTPPFYRLENLGTEWATQAYAKPEENPFEAVVRCQDCHMSLYPYTNDAAYEVTDPATGETLAISSPIPGVFPVGKAASGEDPTGRQLPLPDRPLVTHHFTGVDVPLMSDEELRARLGPDRPPVDGEGTDEHGIPSSLSQRRRDLLEAGVRLSLDRTDAEARLGSRFDVRVTAVALTGHNFPAGFSQERTAWIELTVSAARAGGGDDFVLYQSGYLVDKPHPETGETAPDGNLDDEDLEHLIAVVNPFTHNNDVFERGPDAGPLKRIFEGEAIGLVLFRNELIRLYGPETIDGRPTGIPATNRRHPRTGEVLDHVLEEETFSAAAANGVDNWRGLPPLVPRTYRYAVALPAAAELADVGVQLEGPVKIRAAIHFQHFPPLFLRFLARVSGSVPYRMPDERLRVQGFDVNGPGRAGFEGRRGPADYDFGLMDEARMDRHLRIVRDIATSELSVPLVQGGS